MAEVPNDIAGELTRLEVELRKLEGEYNMDFPRRPQCCIAGTDCAFQC